MVHKNSILISKALIIDDEIEIGFLLSRILRSKGIEVAFVNKLSDARTILTSYKPSLIFLDNHLPDGLGIEFSTYIKSLCPGSKIFIITAKETDLEEAYRNGASEVIFKPFTSEDIFSVMAKHP